MNSKHRSLVILAIVVLGAMGIVAWDNRSVPAPSAVELAGNCVHQAGQEYDLERTLIATKNPDVSTHAFYYQTASDAYTQAIYTCQRVRTN